MRIKPSQLCKFSALRLQRIGGVNRLRVKRTFTPDGSEAIRDIDDLTVDQLRNWINGMLIQTAMPTVSLDSRMWLMDGVTENEWDAIFAVDEDRFSEQENQDHADYEEAREIELHNQKV